MSASFRLAQRGLGLSQAGVLFGGAQAHDDRSGGHEVVHVVKNCRDAARGLRRHRALVDCLDGAVQAPLERCADRLDHDFREPAVPCRQRRRRRRAAGRQQQRRECECELAGQSARLS